MGLVKLTMMTGLLAAAAPLGAQTAPAAPGATQAVPARVTARMLSRVCAENKAACLTYVLGAIDGVVATSMVRGGKHPLCLPANVTNEQLAEATMRHLAAHPETAGANAAVVVVEGLLGAYPCPKR